MPLVCRDEQRDNSGSAFAVALGSRFVSKPYTAIAYSTEKVGKAWDNSSHE